MTAIVNESHFLPVIIIGLFEVVNGIFWDIFEYECGLVDEMIFDEDRKSEFDGLINLLLGCAHQHYVQGTYYLCFQHS